MDFSKYITKKLELQRDDLYKVPNLTRYCMKNEKYPISHVMVRNGSLYIYVTDKNGSDTYVDDYQFFQLKIDRNLISLICMLKYELPMHIWNRDTDSRGYLIIRECNMQNKDGHFNFELQTYHESRLRNEPKYLTTPNPEECTVEYFHNYDHFLSVMLDRYKDYSIFNYDDVAKKCENIEMSAIYNFEYYDESKLILPNEKLYDIIRDKNKSIVELQNVYSDVFYNCEAKDMSDEAKTLFNTIVDCFINAPGTFGPTAISKFLTGKLKKNIKDCEQYNSISNIPQPKLFLQCDMIETIMYTLCILKGQELYAAEAPVFINSTTIKNNDGNSLKIK